MLALLIHFQLLVRTGDFLYFQGKIKPKRHVRGIYWLRGDSKQLYRSVPRIGLLKAFSFEILLNIKEEKFRDYCGSTIFLSLNWDYPLGNLQLGLFASDQQWRLMVFQISKASLLRLLKCIPLFLYYNEPLIISD